MVQAVQQLVHGGLKPEAAHKLYLDLRKKNKARRK